MVDKDGIVTVNLILIKHYILNISKVSAKYSLYTNLVSRHCFNSQKSLYHVSLNIRV